MDTVPKTATQILMDEHRLRARAMSAAARAVDMVREIETLDRRDVHDVAINAAAFAIQSIVENDAELVATRIERDHYKKMALIGLDLSAMTPMILTTK